MSTCGLHGAQAGMTSINDFATTYMCQSLPFGGVKHSGFDRFGGVEGLRGLCVPKAVAEDRWVQSTYTCGCSDAEYITRDEVAAVYISLSCLLPWWGCRTATVVIYCTVFHLASTAALCSSWILVRFIQHVVRSGCRARWLGHGLGSVMLL
jgi:hypothetical protein